MQQLISIVGPTGVGKTAYALHLAEKLNCPIISADSVQIYQGLDVGSGKATDAEQRLASHYMIDLIPPDQAFNAGEYARVFDLIAAELFQKHDFLILVGGTGLYFQAIWDGFDAMPEVPNEVREALNAEFQLAGIAKLQAELAEVDPDTWATIDRQNPARIIRALEVFRASAVPISAYRKGGKARRNRWQDIKIGLELPREILYSKIEKRVDQMLLDGLEEETKRIAASFGMECKGLESLGYREMVGYLRGNYEMAEAARLIKQNTRRYAKRQFTWFRKCADLQWFAPGDHESIDLFITDRIANRIE